MDDLRYAFFKKSRFASQLENIIKSLILGEFLQYWYPEILSESVESFVRV